MNNNKERFARFGIATKGFVYCLIGGLTAAAALGKGGQKTNSSGALDFLSQQTFGQILLWVTVLGLCGFVFWRFYQTFMDPEDKGSDTKGIARRIGYFSSGVFYCFLIYEGIKILTASSSGGGGGKESLISMLLSKPFGQVLVGVVGAIFLGKAIYQFYRAYSGKFKDKVNASGLGAKAQKVILNGGRIGYSARGVVISIISFLTFQAAISASSSEAGGTKDAFDFLQNEFGSIVLIVISLGLVAYGLFMFIKARYRQMLLD